MPRIPSLIIACALALAFCVPGRGQDSPPSLGDLARQAQKDKANSNKPSSAKVITNDDMPSGSGGASGALGGGLGQVAQLSPGSKSDADPSPAAKLAMLETVLDRLEAMDRATLAHNALNDKDINFPGRANWETRLFAARETYVAQARELVQKARQIVASADSLKGNQDPNDPRVKELSAKLQSLIRDAVQADSALQAVMIEGRDLASQPPAH
jgi:hypothetical protein